MRSVPLIPLALAPSLRQAMAEAPGVLGSGRIPCARLLFEDLTWGDPRVEAVVIAHDEREARAEDARRRTRTR
jgi:hypothetical protein